MKDLMELSKFKHIRLSKDRVYTYKGWVLKKFRGKRVMNTNDMDKIDMLRKAGKRYWVITIAVDNKSSIKGTASNNGCAGSVLSKIRAKFIYIISFVETF